MRTTTPPRNGQNRRRGRRGQLMPASPPGRYNLGGEIVKLKGETSRTYVLPINCDSDELYTLRCRIHSHKNDNPREVEILVDTGSIHLNLISRQCAKHLILDEKEIQQGVSWRIKSLHGEESASNCWIKV